MSYSDEAFWQDVLDARYAGTTEAYTLLNASFGVKWGDHLTTSVKAVNLLNDEVQQHVFGDVMKRQFAFELRVQLPEVARCARLGQETGDRRQDSECASVGLDLPVSLLPVSRTPDSCVLTPDVIRLLAIDIDGTLLDSHGVLPEANIDAIARAIDAGVEVALATGRRYDFARSIFEKLRSPLTLILSNGAVVKTCGGETLQRRLLPREVAHDVLVGVPEHREGAAVVFDRPREGQVVFEAIDWEHPRHGRFFASQSPASSPSRIRSRRA